MWRHLAAKVGTSKAKGGKQGCTISLKAAVHPGYMLRALIAKKKNDGFKEAKTEKMRAK
jgi:hypothetical protein